MKPGDIVFFTEAKPSSARKSPKIGFKGHAFGIMLGHVPPFQKDPPLSHILRLMGTHGFVSFDDVGELLGSEQGALMVTKFEDKYYGKEVDPNQPALPLPDPEAKDAQDDPEPEPETGRILGLNGKPIHTTVSPDHPPGDEL